MTVVAFVSQKGGVAKSTLARAVAIEAARAGLSVRIADLDVSQGSQVDWYRDRLASSLEPSPAVQLHGNLPNAMAYAEQVDLLIIDGPAKADADTLAIARIADLVVLPSGASLDDLRPAVRVGNSLLKAGIPASRLIYALTRISTDAEADAARAYLVAATYLVASGYLPERPAYRLAQNSGRAVTETQYTSLRTVAVRLVQSIIDAIPEA